MADKRVVEYILNTSKMGFSHERIRQALLNASHREADVNEAFSEAFGPPAVPKTASPIHNALPPMPKLFTVLVIVVSLFSLAMVFQLFGKTAGFVRSGVNTLTANVVAGVDSQKLSLANVPPGTSAPSAEIPPPAVPTSPPNADAPPAAPTSPPNADAPPPVVPQTTN